MVWVVINKTNKMEPVNNAIPDLENCEKYDPIAFKRYARFFCLSR